MNNNQLKYPPTTVPNPKNPLKEGYNRGMLPRYITSDRSGIIGFFFYGPLNDLAQKQTPEFLGFFCTPVSDLGFFLDLPVKYLGFESIIGSTGIRKGLRRALLNFYLRWSQGMRALI